MTGAEMRLRGCLALLAVGMTSVPGAAEAKTPAILEIPAAALAGGGLEPSNPDDFKSPHLQVREPQGQPPGGMRLVLKGDLNVAVFAINGGRNHFDYFLSDELVLVIAGRATLTTDGTHHSQTFRRGERFFVPQGWRGDWTSSSDYRELACVSRVWFSHLGDRWRPAHSPAADLEVSRVTEDAFASATPTGSLARVSLSNGSDLGVSLLRGEAGLTTHVRALEHDQLFEVTEGSLTLVPADGSRKRQFHAGSNFVLTHTFKGDLVTRTGFQAVVAEPGKQ